MPLENSSDRVKGINAEPHEKAIMDFVKQQLVILDTSSEYLRERMGEGSSSQQQNNRKEVDSMEAYSKTGPNDHLRPLDQVEQRQATLAEQHEVHDQEDLRRQTSDHLRPRDQQTAPDNEEEKKILNLLRPEERQAFKSGDEKSKKKELAEQIYGCIKLMKTLRRTDLEIEEFVNFSVRRLQEYKEHYGNVASSSQQQREIIELSDSEEDGENLPKQKQSSESRSHEGEKRRSDQAQEDTSPSKGQRIDSTTSQYQLYEQQQSKGKELDPMEAHSKTGPSDHLRPLDQVGQGQATLTEQHEVHDQADPTRQAYASSYSDHLGVGLDVEFGYLEFRDGEVEELNKEIEKCKVYQEQKNREIEKKKAKIEKIYHNNNNLISEHTEKITNDLLSEYREKITNDLLSEYRERIKNDLSSEYTEKITNDLLSEYREKIKNDLLSGHNKNLINNLFSKHTEKFITDLISEYKESIASKEPEEVMKIEGEFISKYESKGFDTKSSEELIKSVREINNLQELIQTNKQLISYYERQREKILSGRHETSNQADASSLADHLGVSLDNLDLEFGSLEFRKPHDQIQATSSQSFPENRQPFAAHYPAEAQRESTSQLADVRRQDQIEQRQDPIVQQHGRYDQAGPSIKETIKHRLREFMNNLINQNMNITEKKIIDMLNENKIYAKKDLILSRDCALELSHETQDKKLQHRYESIAWHIRQQLTQQQLQKSNVIYISLYSSD